MKQYILTVMAVFFAAVIGFLLPPQLMKWQDVQRTMESSLEESREVLLAPQPDMSITEKLDLYKQENMNTMQLASGKNYDGESIRGKVKEELEKLAELEILTTDVREILSMDIYMESGPVFVVDAKNSARTMIVWEVQIILKEENVHIQVSMDDETGKILEVCELTLDAAGFTDIKNGMSDIVEVAEKDLEAIAEKWGEYLELELLESYDPMAGTKVTEQNIKKTVKNNQLRCVYGDEIEMSCFMIKDSIGDIQLSIEIYD